METKASPVTKGKSSGSGAHWPGVRAAPLHRPEPQTRSFLTLDQNLVSYFAFLNLSLLLH